MIVGFAGTRKGTSENLIKRIFSGMKNRDVKVVVGDCIGVDEQVYYYCKRNGIPVGVFAVEGNWCKISYQPSTNDVLRYVGSLHEPLKRRLAMRTLELLNFLEKNGGVLIAIYDRYYDLHGNRRTRSRGTLLAVTTAEKRGIPVWEFPATKKGALILVDEYLSLSKRVKELRLHEKVRARQRLDPFEKLLWKDWKKLRTIVALSCPAFGIEIRPRSKGSEESSKGSSVRQVVKGKGSER